MYRQLLYSAGGGVISNVQKGEQAACVTLAIGLGGTGIDCLQNLKRMVYEQVLPDDPEAPVPSYSHIKFLAVDTDRSRLEDDGNINPLDRKTEFLDIFRADIGKLLMDSRNLSKYPECRWLKTPNPEKGEPGLRILSASPFEAIHIKQVCRLLMIEKSDAFVGKVRQLVTEAKQGLALGVDVNVHIFTGLGGAAGSGIFLDVCYLVQKALEDIGEGAHAMTYGYFFLPDVNLSLRHIGSRPDISHYIQSNAYAAMKELDYCMGFGTNGGHWEQKYRGFKYGPVAAAPVKVCHLISARNYNDHAPENGYEHAINVVGEYIIQFLVNSNSSMTAHATSCNNAMQFSSKKYIALGASKASVQIREISTYLGSKMFETFRALRSKYPTNEEIEQFAKENHLDFQGLLMLVMDWTSFDMPVPELYEKEFRNCGENDLGLPNELILPNEIVTHFRNMRDEMAENVEHNISALMHGWRRDRIRENYDSISRVWNVFFALEQMVSDPNKGPFYASAVLYGSDRKNLVDILQSDYEEIRKQLRNYSYDLKLSMDAVKKTRSAYLHPGFLQNRQKLFNAFLERTANYYELTSRIFVLEKMQDMIRSMIEQFKDLYKKHFEPFRKIYDDLLETFHENYLVLSGGAGLGDTDDPLKIPISAPDDPLKMFIPEPDGRLIKLLDSAVEILDFDQEIRRFNDSFFKANDVWAEYNGFKIAKYVSDYIIEVFDEYTRKPMAEYLKVKFETTNPLVIQNKTFCEILRPLNSKAIPLFWKNPLGHQNNADCGYASIPDTSVVIENAADQLILVVPDLYKIKSAFVNKILVLRCKCGLSMSDYNGTRLYKEAYQQDRTVGKHIYEGTEGDPRDWRKLPELVE